MTYNTFLANKVREHLVQFANIEMEEKEMFRGLTYMVNGKMCVNISGKNLMCRYDPSLKPEIAERTGYMPMIMKGKEYRGYCYVEPAGFKNKEHFEFWIKLCLDFNDRAKSSKKK